MFQWGGNICELANLEPSERPAVSGMEAGPNDVLYVSVCNDFFDMQSCSECIGDNDIIGYEHSGKSFPRKESCGRNLSISVIHNCLMFTIQHKVTDIVKVVEGNAFIFEAQKHVRRPLGILNVT